MSDDTGLWDQLVHLRRVNTINFWRLLLGDIEDETAELCDQLLGVVVWSIGLVVMS